jgi:hypothetical protein
MEEQNIEQQEQNINGDWGLAPQPPIPNPQSPIPIIKVSA